MVMASSVLPYFIMAQTKPETITNDQEDTSICITKQDRMIKRNKNKHHILTRNELTKKRMDLIRAKLEESRARYFDKLETQALNCSRPIPRVTDVFAPITNKEINDSTDIGKTQEVAPIRTTQVPCVYYIVSPERQFKTNVPRAKFKKERQKEEHNRDQLVTRQSVTFTSKEDYGITTVRARTSDLENTLGIRPLQTPSQVKSVGHKPIVFPLPMKTPPKNPPVTPATTVTYSVGPRNPPATPSTILTNSAGHRGREWDFDDFETIYKKPIKMTICEDNEIVDSEDIGKPLTPHKTPDKLMSTRYLELPFISFDEQRKALGTAGSYGIKSLDFVRKSVSQELVRKSISQDTSFKKVKFIEPVGAPSIQGSQIGLSFGEVFPFLGHRALTVPDFNSEKSKSLSELFNAQSLPETRLLHKSNGKPKRNSQSLDLPKIDIVSSVYDQLIVKAIESYIGNLPPCSRQARTARQILDQLQNKTINTTDLQREQCKWIGGESMNLSRSHDQWGKHQNGPVVKRENSKKSYNQLEPKCYRLILPGGSHAESKIKTARS